MIDIGFLTADATRIGDSGRLVEAVSAGAVDGDVRESGNRAPGRQCPRCAQPSLIRQEDCDICLSCGYSKCS